MKRFISHLSAGILFLAMPSILYSQQTTFTSVFFEQGSIILASGAEQTADSTYYIAGMKNYNALLIRMDAYGYNLWQNQYEIPETGTLFTKIQPTHDDQFILVGTKGYEYSSGDILCMKLNQNGDTVWTRSIDFGNVEQGTYVQETSDHGFIVSGSGMITGYSDSQMLLVKLDSAGDMEWSKIFQGETKTYAHSVREAPDGGIYVIGEMWNYPGYDIKAILLKLTALGELTWAKRLITPNTYSSGYDLLISDTSLFCLIESGYSTLLAKTDLDGNSEWTRELSPASSWFSNNYFGQKAKLHFTQDSGFIFATTGQFGSLIKLDTLGMVEWGSELFVESSDVVPALDGGYLVVGNGPLYGVELGPTDYPQIGLIKTDSLGDSEDCIFPGWAWSDTVTVAFIPITLTTGTSGMVMEEHPEISSATMTRFDGCVASFGSIAERADMTPQLIVSPNPSNGHFLIRMEPETNELQGVEIFNSTGKRVWSSQSDLRLPVQLDLSFLPDGIYIFISTAEGIRQVQKLVIIQ